MPKSTFSRLLACSATAIISTTTGGKRPLAASGPASGWPAEMFSVASPMAAARTRLPVASREICSERRMGTPLCSSVPSTRQNRATARPRKIGPASGHGQLDRGRATSGRRRSASQRRTYHTPPANDRQPPAAPTAAASRWWPAATRSAAAVRSARGAGRTARRTSARRTPSARSPRPCPPRPGRPGRPPRRAVRFLRSSWVSVNSATRARASSRNPPSPPARTMLTAISPKTAGSGPWRRPASRRPRPGGGPRPAPIFSPACEVCFSQHLQRPQQRHAAAQQVGQLAVGGGQQRGRHAPRPAAARAAGAASSTGVGKIACAPAPPSLPAGWRP